MSDIDPTDITVVGRRPVPEKFSSDLSESPGAHQRPEREGLPSGYRMRADSHYVDQLTSRRPEKGEHTRVSQQEHGELESGVENRDRKGDRVLAQLSEEIASITAAAGLLGSDGSSLARRLSVDLIRAQAWRASWLLRALTLLDSPSRGQMRPKAIGPLLEQLRQGIAPECRLAGVGVQIHASDWNALVSVDEPAFIAGVTGAVMATLGILGQTDGAVIRISADGSAGELRAVEVSQDDATAVSAMPMRFFDSSWFDRPGGSIATIGALTARAAAQHHGGSAVFVAGDRRGTTVRLSLARTH